MVTGVMLTRAQPFHKGHMDVVNQILKENERCLIVIGSANKCNTERNPLMITDRARMITHVLKWHNLTQSKVQLLPCVTGVLRTLTSMRRNGETSCITISSMQFSRKNLLFITTMIQRP